MCYHIVKNKTMYSADTPNFYYQNVLAGLTPVRVIYFLYYSIYMPKPYESILTQTS